MKGSMQPESLDNLRLTQEKKELYCKFAEKYEQLQKYNTAYLCYENALFYTRDKDNDKQTIMKKMDELIRTKDVNVKPVSIVILSYNNMQMTINCIESIRQNNMIGTYQLVVVDNGSTDGILKWLEEQEDIKLVINKKNLGFPIACNQGIKASEFENDIMLLNNDTIVPQNAIFTLRMGLYEDEKIGCCGSVSNRVGNEQQINEQYETLEEYLQYAKQNNTISESSYEEKMWLVGFALLIRRKALDEIGLFDIRFSPGNFEDNDLGIRMQMAGYKMILCHNSFIYHLGSSSFKKNPNQYSEVCWRNQQKLIKKWNMNVLYYSYSRNDILQLIHRDKEDTLNVLEVGCGFGSTLLKLKYQYKNASVFGIERNETVATIGRNNIEILAGDIETLKLPFAKNRFDYIIFADVLEHLRNPKKVLEEMKSYLNEDGAILTSIPNILHASVIVPLLKGNFTYKKSGILDETHMRFFTLREIEKLFDSCGFQIDEILTTRGEEDVFYRDIKMIEQLYKIEGICEKQQFSIYQYVIMAKQKK